MFRNTANRFRALALTAPALIVGLSACTFETPVVRTVASCTDVTTELFRTEIEAATDQDDLKVRLTRLSEGSKPEQCEGLTVEELEEVSSRVRVNITADLMSRVFEQGFTE